MPTPHKHTEVIKAWADGAEIESRPYSDSKWAPCPCPAWTDTGEYRVKPAAPKWPQTTMTNREINGAIAQDPLELVSSGATETARRIINKAIEHECSTGALVPADKVREIEAKARDEGASEAMKVSSEFAREIAWRALQANDIYPTSGQLDSLMPMVYP